MNTQLTPSQQRAQSKLDFFFKLALNGINSVEGISPRPIPLIVGPSGSGKTFLVGDLAAQYELALFSINITNWIVRGSRNESQVTMEQLREFISGNERGVIFFDEVNKLTNSHIGQSSWMADVFTECIAFLDQDTRLESMGLRGLVEKLRSNFIIIGAGAFQSEWQAIQNAGPVIGFAAGDQIQETEESSFELAIQSQGIVPEELLFRFNDRLIVILPPTGEEYGRRIASIRAALSLPALENEELAPLIESALSSGKSMRWLEGYLTECLSHVPVETLESLAATPTVRGESSGNSASNGTDLQKMDLKQINAMREACYVRFEECLRALSYSSRQLHVLLQGVFLGYGSGVNDEGRMRLCKSLNKIGELLVPDGSGEKQLLVVGKSLEYLAEKGLSLTSALGCPTERGKLASEISRIASSIADTMPCLLAGCGECSEERAIREQVLGFVISAKDVTHHLQELRQIEAEKSVR